MTKFTKRFTLAELVQVAAGGVPGHEGEDHQEDEHPQVRAADDEVALAFSADRHHAQQNRVGGDKAIEIGGDAEHTESAKRKEMRDEIRRGYGVRSRETLSPPRSRPISSARPIRFSKSSRVRYWMSCAT